MAYTSATYDDVKEFLERMRTWLTLMGGQVLYDTYCISFHFAEHDMYLPLKKITETI